MAHKEEPYFISLHFPNLVGITLKVQVVKNIMVILLPEELRPKGPSMGLFSSPVPSQATIYGILPDLFGRHGYRGLHKAPFRSLWKTCFIWMIIGRSYGMSYGMLLLELCSSSL